MKCTLKKIVRLSVAMALLVATNMNAQVRTDSILNNAKLKIFENPQQAIEQALSIANNESNSIDDKLEALLIISTAYASQRDYEKSLRYALDAELYIPSIESETYKIRILNKIGAQYQRLKIYNKAIDYLDKSLLLTNQLPEKDSISKFLGYNYGTRGFIYREQMSCDIALNYFQKSIESFTTALSDPIMNANISIMYYNRGNCFLTFEDYLKAEENFALAIAHAQVIEANSLIAFGQKGLAEMKTLTGNYNESIVILNEALELSKNVGDLVLNQGLYNAMANNYLATNNWEKYKVFHNKYEVVIRQIKETEIKTINQSLRNIENDSSVQVEKIKKEFGEQ